MTRFFVSGVAEGDAEQEYHRLAEVVGADASTPGRRVRQVFFKIGRESWVATVGRSPEGTRPEHRRVKGKLTTTTDKLADDSTVLAIYPGDPFVVVTDAAPVGTAESRWPSPVRAKPSRIVYFEA